MIERSQVIRPSVNESPPRIVVIGPWKIVLDIRKEARVYFSMNLSL
jgi:hypothetical protein